jgi:hypothetical protein
LTSIYNPQIEGKFTKTSGGSTLVGQPTYFMVARISLLSELVLPIIKKFMAPLEVGPEIALN